MSENTDEITRAKTARQLAWVVALSALALMFDGYDLVVYGTVLPTLMSDPSQIGQLSAGQAGTLGSYALVGVLVGALSAGAVSDQAEFSELGQIIAGQRPGRVSDQQVTLCDLTGTGAQETAFANLAFERAVAASKGLAFLS